MRIIIIILTLKMKPQYFYNPLDDNKALHIDSVDHNMPMQIVLQVTVVN
ncbi:MAG: hypothetical protein PHU52_03050 [Dehalococcoidales bacterium]|nr:hypothetical protein [Dehalococcoidales bacterium]